jgi:hypothetical protein
MSPLKNVYGIENQIGQYGSRVGSTPTLKINIGRCVEGIEMESKQTINSSSVSL